MFPRWRIELFDPAGIISYADCHISAAFFVRQLIMSIMAAEWGKEGHIVKYSGTRVSGR